MTRIVIFSDSLAMPRQEPEITDLEDTYPYLLRADCEVFQCSIGGCVIKELLTQTFYYSQFKPDIVILQSGIVDCAPRAFSKVAECFFDNTYIGYVVKAIIKKTITTKFIRNLRRKSWTSIKQYRSMIESFKSTFPNATVYALSILPASAQYEQRVPGITRKINQYNAVLSEVFKEYMIDLSSVPVDCIMSDFHHLNKHGHRYVYDKIMEKISGNVKS